jgi:NAD(P)-dependent dehydrogenase (short-subunit alcohol dehydrogenase family)
MTGQAASPRLALVIGGYGALGTAVSVALTAAGLKVLRSSRVEGSDDDPDRFVLDPVSAGSEEFRRLPPLEAVVWAHGVNVNDSLDQFDSAAFERLIDVNVGTIARNIRDLLGAGRIRDGARLVVISSIWEQVARPGKLSYTVSKAAIGGLVRAAALDLGSRSILINAVLPGVVDTDMTRATLTPEQINSAAAGTAFNRLVTAEEVADMVGYLCSPGNTGVTGQSIHVDLGFSLAHPL